MLYYFIYHVVSAVAEKKQKAPDDGVVPVVVRVELLVEDVAAFPICEESVVHAVPVIVVVGYRARYDPACFIRTVSHIHVNLTMDHCALRTSVHG